MQIDTRIFRRIVLEKQEEIRRAAIKAIADTMEETVRFGTFRRDYVEGCAEDRLAQALSKN